MSSTNTSRPKTSRVAKISVKPVWRRKIDSCQNSNNVVPNQPTPKPHENNSSKNQSQTSKIASTKIPPQNNNLNITNNSSKTSSTLKHLFHPYHVFMITQAQTCLHHQEYHHHILQLHMSLLCFMLKPLLKITTNLLHHHHLHPNKQSSLMSLEKPMNLMHF